MLTDPLSIKDISSNSCLENSEKLSVDLMDIFSKDMASVCGIGNTTVLETAMNMAMIRDSLSNITKCQIGTLAGLK